MDLIGTFQAGGPLMYGLLAAALIGIAVIFERMVVLSRIPSGQKAEQQLNNVEEALRSGGIEECSKVVAKGRGALNYIFARLVKRFDTLLLEKRELQKVRNEYSGDNVQTSNDPVAQFLVQNSTTQEFREELQMTIEDSSNAYLSRFLPVLNTVGNIAPLLGLLGTITGMISAFESIAKAGTGDPQVVAGGISQALITTATGLIVAIPSIIFYRYLGAKAESQKQNVEIYAITFSNSLLALLEKEEV